MDLVADIRFVWYILKESLAHWDGLMDYVILVDVLLSGSGGVSEYHQFVLSHRLVFMVHDAVFVPCKSASPRLSSDPEGIVGRVVSAARETELARHIDIAFCVLRGALRNFWKLSFVILPW